MSARDILANERNFLGCLLRSPHEYWQVHDGVTADMFMSPLHREIYTAIGDITEGGRQVTISTLLAHLPEEYEDTGPTVGTLATLKENALEAGSARDYAESISGAAGMRRLSSLSKWIDKELKDRQRLPDDIAADLVLRAQEIMAQASPIRPVKLSDLTEKIITASGKARDTDQLPGFTTGLVGLDEMIGLLMGGDFIGVIGALGEGKSAVLAQIGKHIASHAPVLSCHNEMSPEQNATRAVAGESGMSVREVREGAFDFTGYERVKEAQGRIEKLQYHLYTDPKMTVRSIKSRALQMKRTIGLGAITIDGLKRLKTETKHRDKWDRMEEITGAIKDLAIELNVPILLAVQRTRTARRRDNPVPQLDDADAPTLETDADIVLGVWREEAWLMMNKPNQKAGGESWEEWEHKVQRAKGMGKMAGLKVRSGNPFEEREFKWNGPATRFEDL